MGIICIIIGLVIFGISYIIAPQSAPQQTVQYLGYVCSSIFIAGGFICLQVYLSIKKLGENEKHLVSGTDSDKVNNDGTSYKCPHCNEELPFNMAECPHCGKKITH